MFKIIVFLIAIAVSSSAFAFSAVGAGHTTSAGHAVSHSSSHSASSAHTVPVQKTPVHAVPTAQPTVVRSTTVPIMVQSVPSNNKPCEQSKLNNCMVAK